MDRFGDLVISENKKYGHKKVPPTSILKRQACVYT